MRLKVEWIVLIAGAVSVAALAVSLVIGLLAPRGTASYSAAGTPAVRPSDVPLPAQGERVRVEVLNGAGKAGLARLATERLRDQGFDVVYFGNAAGGRRDSSVVLDRLGNPDLAKSVAAALGIARVASARDTSRYLEVTVVLGADWPPPSSRGSER